ncbi:proline--tRNA ligase [Candidatus Woesearchaeota archaeon]|nr:proline--tRNA ligase [Candidatus Woesearchaeota archaeon]
MAKKEQKKSRGTKGISVSKENDFSEWYTQVIQKADLADYSAVSGCMVIKPAAWAIWEKIRDQVDERIKKLGVQNVAFPMFIPESLLTKEAKHIEGFAPEVAWVTHAGNTKLSERLAVRPTSEAIMYDSYAKWIRSHNDLPLKYNQWSNVVRWEFKHPTPFFRTREFYFNEGHTCFATEKEAEKEGEEIIAMYTDVCENFLALPALIGKKSEKETFAGAVYSTSMEFMMDNGKAIQGPVFHHDGQNFSKAYDIKFQNEEGKESYVWQNTWAISTRMIGVMFAIHSDDKGLVLPPKLAATQAVIVPILFEDSKAEVLKKAREIKKSLEKKGISVYLDDRENYSPGWKFNEWEMKGIPVRIELGPRDLEKHQVMVARRDTSEKQALEITAIADEVRILLDDIQKSLFDKAQTILDKSILKVDNLKDAKAAFKDKKIVIAPWCSAVECEDIFKEKTGAKSLNSPLEQPKLKKSQKCSFCKEEAKLWMHFGKSY